MNSGTETTLTDGVRRSLEDARDTAERNIDYLLKEVSKARAEIEAKQSRVAEMEAEIGENEAARDQAKGMLDD